MEPTLWLLIAVIVVALAFDVTNGMHDTANSVGPLLATRAVGPRVAVLIVAVSNGAGALMASGAVAATIGSGIVSPDAITLDLVLAAIAGAICWNVGTWYLGIPCSSSLALIGGLVGAGLVAGGPSVVGWSNVGFKVFVPALIAPIVGGGLAIMMYVVITRSLKRVRRRTAERGARRAQIGAACLQSFAHGTNDAQKTMGVIALALLVWSGNGDSEAFSVPFWVVLACATSLTIGTLAGGWRIIGTMSRGITRLDVSQGVAATAAGGIVLLLASRAGLPISTTYATVGSIMGAGSVRGVRRVRGQVGGEIAVAWAITVPCAAAVAMLCSVVAATAPLVLTICVLAMLAWMLVRNHRDGNLSTVGPTTPNLAPAVVLARDSHERQIAAGAQPWWQANGSERRAQPNGATVT